MSDTILQSIHATIEAWNDHDIHRLLNFYAPDYEAVDVSQAAPIRGREGIERLVQSIFQAFPDLSLSNDEPIVQGDRAAVAWTMVGTQAGTVMRIPPTHRQIRVSGVSILAWQDGKISRALHVWDVAGLLRSIGLLPDL